MTDTTIENRHKDYPNGPRPENVEDLVLAFKFHFFPSAFRRLIERYNDGDSMWELWNSFDEMPKEEIWLSTTNLNLYSLDVVKEIEDTPKFLFNHFIESYEVILGSSSTADEWDTFFYTLIHLPLAVVDAILASDCQVVYDKAVRQCNEPGDEQRERFGHKRVRNFKEGIQAFVLAEDDTLTPTDWKIEEPELFLQMCKDMHALMPHRPDVD